MFFSKYIPVDIRRTSAAIYHPNGVFPVENLLQAEAALSCNYGLNKNVIVENGIVSFPLNSSIRWTIPDVYLACEAYHTADDNNFSFYTVTSDNKHPQLFVSKAFKGHRVLVNAHTFESLILTKPNIIKRVASMIDHHYSFQYCMDFFDTAKALETNTGKFLDAIITDRNTSDETMIVSPLMSTYANDNIYYSKDLLDEYFALLLDPNTETELARVDGDTICRKNVKNHEPITIAFAKELVDTYQKLLAGKSNYLTLCDETYESCYYLSTNFRYLVNARTFEVRVIENLNMKQQLKEFAVDGKAPLQSLNYCWQMVNRKEEN